MNAPARPVWIIERAISRGQVRIGVLGTRFVAELNGRAVKLNNNDILSTQDVAASRHTAPMAVTLRNGGYSHLLGGQVALLPGEAHQLKQVAMGTQEGLRLHRAKLIEALDKETDEDADPADIASGLGHHGDERALRITPARQQLNDFDRRHPEIAAQAKATPNA